MSSSETAVTETKEIRTLCRHIFTDGRRCASPALRGPEGPEPFCYYHHTHRKPVPARHADKQEPGHFWLPEPEDRSAIQHSIGQVLQRIAAGQIDTKRAGQLLYGLQIAMRNLRPEPRDSTPERPVEQTVEDPELGTVAPFAEFSTPWDRAQMRERALLNNIKRLEEQVVKAEAQVAQARQETARITAECDRTQDLFVKNFERVRELESQLNLPTVQAVADLSPRLNPIRTRLYPKTGGRGVLGQQTGHRPGHALHRKLTNRQQPLANSV